MPSAVLQAIASKYLFLTAVIYAARTFTGAFIVPNEGVNGTLATVRVPEDALSFLNGFVEGDFAVHKRVVKRSVADVSVKPRVPQYMLDLYERLEDRKLQVKFDTVRSFHCEGVSEMKELPSSWPKKIAASNFYKFIFNISHFPHSEYALLAQLRIQAVQLLEEKRFEYQTLDTFSLLENPPTLLSSRDFNPHTESLYTVDITALFQNALDSYEKQLFFGLSIPKDLKDFLILDPVLTDGPQLLVMSKTVTLQGAQEDRILTRMRRSLDEYNVKLASGNISRSVDVGKFPMQLRSNSSEALRRHRRSEEEDEEAEEQSNYIVEELGRIRKGKLRRKKNPCRRKPLHVNFAAINYDQWIIAPPSYDAFECTGRCSFPMSAHLAPTKHAIIQTLMHSLEPKQVSRASCVPIKLTPISILYVDDDGSVTYKYDYGDMVVSECGCR